MPLAIATTVALAHLLAPGEYGRMAVLTFSIAMVSAIAGLGTVTVFQRRVSLAHGGDDVAAQRSALQMAGAATAAQMSVVLISVCLLFHGWLAISLMAIYCLTVAVWTPAAILLTSTNRGAALAKTAMVSALMTGAAQITAAALTHDPDLVVAAAMVASALPHLALIWLAGDRSLALPRWRMPKLRRPDWRLGLMSLGSAQVTTLVFNQSELIFFRPSQGYDRGRFAAVSTVGARATLLIDSLFGTAAPGLTTLQGRSNEEYQRGVNALFRTATLLFTVLFPAASVGAALLTPYVYPGSYGDLRLWMIPLMAISLLQTAAQPSLASFAALGAPGRPLIAAVFAAAVDLAVSAALVPAWGLAGAVVAAVIGGSGYLIAVVSMSAHLVDRRIFVRFVVGILSATTGGCLGALGLALWTTPHSLLGWAVLPAAVMYGALIARLLRPLTTADVDRLSSAFGRSAALLGRLVHFASRDERASP